MPDFRISTPARFYKKKQLKHYRSYKKYLVIDFSNRCGYCDGSDIWNGGHRTYHIDHFAPKDQFPLLENDYSNLIYSCPFCNSSKSNKWPSSDPTVNVVHNKGFLNPLTDNFNVHFVRDIDGNIIGQTDIAKDMVRSLNLSLERHSIIWKLTKLENLISEYEIEIINAVDIGIKERLINIHYRLLKIFYAYHSKLRKINKQ